MAVAATDTNPLIEAALKVAAKGIPVFPTVNKAPSWSNEDAGVAKGMGGYKLASTNPERVKELFSHNRAAEVSVPMGAMSGLMCIDCDVYKNIPGLDDWMEENTKFLGDTMCHKTRSGGLHFFFKHPGDNIRFPATLREGVDVKAVGTGYVVWPDGIGDYTVINDTEAKPFPMELLKEAMKAKGGTGSFSVGSAYNSDSDGDLIAKIQTAEEIYPSLRSLSYRMAGRRSDRDSLIEFLINTMDGSVAADPSHPRHEDWIDRKSKIVDLVDSAIEKHNKPIFDEDTAKKLAESKSFIDTEQMMAAGNRPVGPQRETKPEDLEKRVKEAELSSAYTAIDLSELHTETIPPVEWIIPGVIPKGNSGGLAGSSNVGKTRFLAALAVGVASGRTDLLGFPKMDEPMPVLWLANEERVDDIKRRIKAVGRHYDVKSGVTILVRGKDDGSLRLAGVNEVRTLEIDEKNLAELIAAIRSIDAALLFLDPYVTLAESAEENGTQAAEVLRKALNMVQNLTGATTLFAHHTPKGERSKHGDWYRGSLESLRGSGAIGGALDFCFTLANWWPSGTNDSRTWGNKYLDEKLSRWIVLDNAKVREGERIDPIVYELVGQEMAEGEGMDIGVCRLSSKAEAKAVLMSIAVEELATTTVYDALIDTMGIGNFALTEVVDQMYGVSGWPLTTKDTKVRGELKRICEMLSKPVQRGDNELQITSAGNGRGKRWKLTIGSIDDEDA